MRNIEANREAARLRMRRLRAADPEKYREYRRAYRAKNRDQVRERARAWTKKNEEYLMLCRHARSQWVGTILNTIKLFDGCERCGYKENPVALDFHHRDPAEKSFQIGPARMMRLDKVINETFKCDVLCANCHRIEEAKRRTVLA